MGCFCVFRSKKNSRSQIVQHDQGKLLYQLLCFWRISEPYCSSFDSVWRHPDHWQRENLLVQGAKKSHKKLLPRKQAWTGFLRPCLSGRLRRWDTSCSNISDVAYFQQGLYRSCIGVICPIVFCLEHRHIGTSRNFRNRENSCSKRDLSYWIIRTWQCSSN